MKQGIIYGVMAYLAWGLLPLYWKLFDDMSAWEVLSQRIVWSFISLVLVITVKLKWRQMKVVVSSRRIVLAILLCAVFITTNWLIYIWAVNSDHVLETSLGYYMNPIVSVLFGVLFLKEKLRMGQWISIFIAGIGVVIMTIQYGKFPWIAIVLAVSFGCYGLAKKVANLDALLGLTWETIIAFPVAFLYLAYLHTQGTDRFFVQPKLTILWMVLSGVATAIPLFWFAQAAKRLPLSMVGFIQYIAPTTSLLLAVFVFKEPFTKVQFISFTFIWVSLIVYTASSFKPKGRNKMKEAV